MDIEGLGVIKNGFRGLTRVEGFVLIKRAFVWIKIYYMELGV